MAQTAPARRTQRAGAAQAGQNRPLKNLGPKSFLARRLRARRFPAGGIRWRWKISECNEPFLAPHGRATCARGARRLTSAGALDPALSTASKRNEGLAGLSRASVFR